MSRYIKQGINPFTRKPFDLLNADAFSAKRPAQRRALLLSPLSICASSSKSSPAFPSDERADLCWGDVGRVYLFARTSDVHTRRFDRVVLRGDCY